MSRRRRLGILVTLAGVFVAAGDLPAGARHVLQVLVAAGITWVVCHALTMTGTSRRPTSRLPAYPTGLVVLWLAALPLLAALWLAAPMILDIAGYRLPYTLAALMLTGALTALLTLSSRVLNAGR